MRESGETHETISAALDVAAVRDRRGRALAGARQCLLSLQFHLHRVLPGAGNFSLYEKSKIRQKRCPVCGGSLYACIPRNPFLGKHAAGGLLVFFVPRSL